MDYLDFRYEEVLNLEEDEVELLWTQLDEVRQRRANKPTAGKGAKF